MRKATVTYVAPYGDDKTVTVGGVAFQDGKAVEVNDYDNPHLMSKLPGMSAMFDVEMGKEDDSPPPKAKRGRPSNADIAAAKAAAEQAEAEAKTAKEKADAAKADADKMAKATDREVTKAPTEAPKADVKAGMNEATGHDFEKDRQANVAQRDAQAKGIGANEQGTMQTEPMTYPPGQQQNALNKSDPAV